MGELETAALPQIDGAAAMGALLALKKMAAQLPLDLAEFEQAGTLPLDGAQSMDIDGVTVLLEVRVLDLLSGLTVPDFVCPCGAATEVAHHEVEFCRLEADRVRTVIASIDCICGQEHLAAYDYGLGRWEVLGGDRNKRKEED